MQVTWLGLKVQFATRTSVMRDMFADMRPLSFEHASLQKLNELKPVI
jgi:hypothetical protein